QSVHSGKALEVSGNSTADGAIAQQWGYRGANNQKWRIESVGGGYYRVVSANSGKCLDVSSAATTDGTGLQQWACGNNSASQSFQFNLLSTARPSLSQSQSQSQSRELAGADGGPAVYPNPSAEAFTIAQAGEFRYVIQDAAGQPLETGAGTGHVTAGGRLKPGIYIVRVQSATDIKTIKILRN
ncbi:MAG: RICIN domain-containing protein, partial [Hymenobacter sp.]|nr:RICIN domain-containing protein [Hymenobacter sp.]